MRRGASASIDANKRWLHVEIRWKISSSDVKRLKAFVASQRSNSFVASRIQMNVKHRSRATISRHLIWLRIVGSLLTTQQRSGPDSAIYRFIATRPFPLRYAVVQSRRDAGRFAATTLRRFGGVRRWQKIADELQTNLLRLDGGLWKPLLEHCRGLRTARGYEREREAARFVDEHLAGFGPKQSRNLLQALGLTRYEIPLDSRVTKWLNEFGFPLRLSATGLNDADYYEMVLDGVRELCRRSGLYPCVLDAAIFVSFDAAAWPENAIIY